MKKTILILLASFTASALLAQNKETPFQVKSLTGESVKEVEVQTSGGNISLEGAGAEKARVEVFIWANNNKGSNISKEEIQKRLDEYYDLNIGVAGNKLSAIAKPKSKMKDWKNGLSISFKVYVSKDVSTHLSTSGGNIDLREVTGDQHISTSGGNLKIDHVTGKLKGSTSGGNINVENSTDNIDLSTSGGNIVAENCKGGIKLGTSGGSLELVNLDGNIDATTSGGNVRGNEIKGDLEASTSGGNVDMSGLSCNVTTSTSGGDIKIVVSNPSKFIKVKNSGGRIELQLPAGKGYDLALSGDKVKADNLGNFQGKVEDDHVDGKMNGGGTQVSANTSGRVILTFK